MIAIINYGLGNLTSILNMHKRLGIDAIITNDVNELSRADKLILPGVGHFKKGMENLHASGLKILLDDLVLKQHKPILGICLGAQLMTVKSEEGGTNGLCWVDAETVAFDKTKMNSLKVPHMSWSDILIKKDSPLFMNLPVEPRFYHVHSFHFKFLNPAQVTATSLYGFEFASAFQKDNIYGTQFHPEKSHKFGMAVLRNFSNI